MATYEKVSRSIPSQQRAAVISNVSEGDRIDFVDVLGRPARSVIFNLVTSSDIVQYRINNLKRLRTQRVDSFSEVDKVSGVFGTTGISWWSQTGSVFTATGATQLETADGLVIESLQIDSLSLPSGSTTISITCT